MPRMPSKRQSIQTRTVHREGIKVLSDARTLPKEIDRSVTLLWNMAKMLSIKMAGSWVELRDRAIREEAPCVTPRRNSTVGMEVRLVGVDIWLRISHAVMVAMTLLITLS